MIHKKVIEIQRERSEQENAFGLTISVHADSGRVCIKAHVGPAQGIGYTFRNVDEVETIFNKSIDRLEPLDLQRISNHKYRY